MRTQQLGWVITFVSIIVIGLLIGFKVQLDSKSLKACENICGNEKDSCSMAECPYHQGSSYSWTIIAISILSAFLAGIGFYLTRMKTELIVTEKEYDLTALNEEEKNIFLFVKEHPGGVYQSELAKQFDISRVRTTRILDVLEQLRLIERKRRGMTNLVAVDKTHGNVNNFK